MPWHGQARHRLQPTPERGMSHPCVGDAFQPVDARGISGREGGDVAGCGRSPRGSGSASRASRPGPLRPGGTAAASAPRRTRRTGAPTTEPRRRRAWRSGGAAVRASPASRRVARGRPRGNRGDPRAAGRTRRTFSQSTTTNSSSCATMFQAPRSLCCDIGKRRQLVDQAPPSTPSCRQLGSTSCAGAGLRGKVSGASSVRRPSSRIQSPIRSISSSFASLPPGLRGRRAAACPPRPSRATRGLRRRRSGRRTGSVRPRSLPPAPRPTANRARRSRTDPSTRRHARTSGPRTAAPRPARRAGRRFG